jgi:hypothetical protein
MILISNGCLRECQEMIWHTCIPAIVVLPQVRSQTLRSHRLTTHSLVGITFLEEPHGLKILPQPRWHEPPNEFSWAQLSTLIDNDDHNAITHLNLEPAVVVVRLLQAQPHVGKSLFQQYLNRQLCRRSPPVSASHRAIRSLALLLLS